MNKNVVLVCGDGNGGSSVTDLDPVLGSELIEAVINLSHEKADYGHTGCCPEEILERKDMRAMADFVFSRLYYIFEEDERLWKDLIYCARYVQAEIAEQECMDVEVDDPNDTDLPPWLECCVDGEGYEADFVITDMQQIQIFICTKTPKGEEEDCLEVIYCRNTGTFTVIGDYPADNRDVHACVYRVVNKILPHDSVVEMKHTLMSLDYRSRR